MNDEKKNVENSNIKGESTKHLKKEKIKKRKAFIDMKVREARENFEKARRDLLKIQNKSLKEDIFIEGILSYYAFKGGKPIIVV